MPATRAGLGLAAAPVEEEGNLSPGERWAGIQRSNSVAAAAAVTAPRFIPPGNEPRQLSRCSGLPFHLVPQSLPSVQPMERVQRQARWVRRLAGLIPVLQE